MKRMNLRFSKLFTKDLGKLSKLGAYVLCGLAIIISLVMYVSHTEKEIKNLKIENEKLNLKIVQVDKALTEEAVRAKSMEHSLTMRFKDLIYYIENGTGRGG